MRKDRPTLGETVPVFARDMAKVKLAGAAKESADLRSYLYSRT